MSKKDWKKQLMRVKQIADQNLGRAEKTEVLSDELQNLEKQVDIIKHIWQTTGKRLMACSQAKKKVPEATLATTMQEAHTQLAANESQPLLSGMFGLTSGVEEQLSRLAQSHATEVETQVTQPIQQMLEEDIPNIHKVRKNLSKLVLDMDTAKSRYHSALRENQYNKLQTLKDEMEDSQTRVEQCRDQLSTEMFTFVAKESLHSNLLVTLIQAQARYHQQALNALQEVIPQMEDQVEQHQQVPTYGTPLEEHLRRTGREIATVLDDCIAAIMTLGLEEEGLLRIAGSASKVKKLKASFDSGMVDMNDYVHDIHCVAGALKLYLRELPEPLMTFDLYEEWMEATHLPQDQKLQALWCVVDKLPKANYDNLRYLIKFLAQLAELSDQNKMTTSNIAIVIGPNLIWSKGNDGPSVVTTSVTSVIVDSLVTHADWFFPGELETTKLIYGRDSSVRGDGGGRGCEVRADATYTIPEHKACKNCWHSKDVDFHKTTPSKKELTLAEKRRSLPPPPPPPTGKKSSLESAIGATVNMMSATASAHSNNSTQGTPTQLSAASSVDSNFGTLPNNRHSVAGLPLPMNGTLPRARTRAASSDRFYTPPPKPHVDNSDTMSDTGRVFSYVISEEDAKRAFNPSVTATPPKSVHGDMYDTVFALQALNQHCCNDYLTRVRGLWDGHLNNKTHNDGAVAAAGASGPDGVMCTSSVSTATPITSTLPADAAVGGTSPARNGTTSNPAPVAAAAVEGISPAEIVNTSNPAPVAAAAVGDISHAEMAITSNPAAVGATSSSSNGASTILPTSTAGATSYGSIVHHPAAAAAASSTPVKEVDFLSGSSERGSPPGTLSSPAGSAAAGGSSSSLPTAQALFQATVPDTSGGHNNSAPVPDSGVVQLLVGNTVPKLTPAVNNTAIMDGPTASPRPNRRGKKPAPMPPAIPDRPSLTVSVTDPADSTDNSSRPSMPPPPRPVSPAVQNTISVDTTPLKMSPPIADKPMSPRYERPSEPPPPRPTGPPADKKPEKPDKPDKPDRPPSQELLMRRQSDNATAAAAAATNVTAAPGGAGSGGEDAPIKPPRPSVPPPPPRRGHGSRGDKASDKSLDLDLQPPRPPDRLESKGSVGDSTDM